LAGRKTKLTEERFKQIVNLVKVGNFASVAASAAGISEATYYGWLKRGREEGEALKEGESGSIFFEFLEAIKKAEGQAEARSIMRIQTASEENWTAAAWYLERKYPDRWGRKDRSKVEVTDSRDVVDRVPPTLSDVLAVLSEIDQLPGEDDIKH